LALGEELIHREFLSSPRIFFTLGEEFFAESPRGGSRQRLLLSAKALFLVVFVFAENLSSQNLLLAVVYYYELQSSIFLIHFYQKICKTKKIV
jgi:hypothetical protein